MHSVWCILEAYEIILDPLVANAWRKSINILYSMFLYLLLWHKYFPYYFLT